jgi:hypothetical protein
LALTYRDSPSRDQIPLGSRLHVGSGASRDERDPEDVHCKGTRSAFGRECQTFNGANMKITVKFLKSTGTFAIFAGSKNHGSNFATDKEAVTAAQKKFPGCTVVIKDFFKRSA